MRNGWRILRLHVKTLIQPQIPVAAMVRRIAQVYATARVHVRLAGVESLNLPALLDVNVGASDGTMTPDLEQLYVRRQPASSLEPVVYLVRSLIPPADGCSTCPPNIPAVVISQRATEWTLAHEIGHLLGLAHVDDDHNLMTGNGTENITNPPPVLAPAQAKRIHASPLIQRLKAALKTQSRRVKTRKNKKARRRHVPKRPAFKSL
jgi:hypothetical protein